MNTETVKTNKSAKDIMLTAQVPRQTTTYKPISHRQLVDLTLERVFINQDLTLIKRTILQVETVT
ncbi:MAG: hypothetical protein CM15mV19_0190 [uncultured marine virus]|nr:MAG: hypothetical protein CM15mV19_0190 [uncultured marine virus]